MMGAITGVVRLIRDFTLLTLSLTLRIGALLVVSIAAVNPLVARTPVSELTIAQLVPVDLIQLALTAAALIAMFSLAVDAQSAPPSN